MHLKSNLLRLFPSSYTHLPDSDFVVRCFMLALMWVKSLTTHLAQTFLMRSTSPKGLLHYFASRISSNLNAGQKTAHITLVLRRFDKSTLLSQSSCNFPLMSVCWSVGRSPCLSQGGKLHFHAAIGALVHFIHVQTQRIVSQLNNGIHCSVSTDIILQQKLVTQKTIIQSVQCSSYLLV